MTWVSYLLSKHPEVQSRARKECQDVCGSVTPDAVTAEKIDSMHYLDAVCNEVLRLFPPVAITSRICNKPTSVGGMIFPKGALMSRAWPPPPRATLTFRVLQQIQQ